MGDMLQPSVDATAWQIEVEKVLPHLKVTIRNDHRVSGNIAFTWCVGITAIGCTGCAVPSVCPEIDTHLDMLNTVLQLSQAKPNTVCLYLTVDSIWSLIESESLCNINYLYLIILI